MSLSCFGARLLNEYIRTGNYRPHSESIYKVNLAGKSFHTKKGNISGGCRADFRLVENVTPFSSAVPSEGTTEVQGRFLVFQQCD